MTPEDIVKSFREALGWNDLVSDEVVVKHMASFLTIYSAREVQLIKKDAKRSNEQVEAGLKREIARQTSLYGKLAGKYQKLLYLHREVLDSKRSHTLTTNEASLRAKVQELHREIDRLKVEVKDKDFSIVHLRISLDRAYGKVPSRR